MSAMLGRAIAVLKVFVISIMLLLVALGSLFAAVGLIDSLILQSEPLYLVFPKDSWEILAYLAQGLLLVPIPIACFVALVEAAVLATGWLLDRFLLKRLGKSQRGITLWKLGAGIAVGGAFGMMLNPTDESWIALLLAAMGALVGAALHLPEPQKVDHPQTTASTERHEHLPTLDKYDYRGIGWLIKAITTALGAADMLATTLGGAAIVVAVIREPKAWEGLLWVLFLAPLWLIGVLLVNLYPTVWVGGDCLLISFLFGRVRIRWEDIITIGPSRARTLIAEITVVQAREITGFHMLYGLLYARSGDPSFLIMGEIRNYGNLLEEIRDRVKQARIEHPPAIPEIFHRWR